MNTRLRVMATVACTCCLSVAWWAKAQQAGRNDQPRSGPILPADPTTRANAHERVRATLKAAREAEAKHDRDFESSDYVRRLREVPAITLPLLAPYAMHPSDQVRDAVQAVAADALTGESIFSQPVDENTRDLAMRLLAQIATFRSISAPAAVGSLYSLLLAGYIPGHSEPPNVVERYARAGVKRGLMRYVQNSGNSPRAAALLSLFKEDAEVGKFLARIAKEEKYPFAFSLALTQWNDGNALEAVEYELKTMEPLDLRSVAEMIRFIDHPQVLRMLASHLDDKRDTSAIGTYDHGPNADDRPFMRHVCDHVLAALKIKLEGAKLNLGEPKIASDEELAAAKQRFGPLIDALPIPNAPPA